jgi:dTDP-4-dehydrorhamnose 3,5-epimerase
MDGVIITPLKQIEDGRGKVMHFLKSDWDVFTGFGEVYFSTVKSGKVKGWKKHTIMTQNLVCVIGSIKLVMFDDRNDSSSCGQLLEISFGEQNYCLVTVPPGIWVSFTSLEGVSILSNCASILHDPEEALSLPIGIDKIPYRWEGFRA